MNDNLPATPHILLVEDHQIALYAFSDWLALRGYEYISEASNVDAALEVATQERIDVAVIDIKLPQHNNLAIPEEEEQHLGLHLARELRQLQPDVGIVLVSAAPDLIKEVRALINDLEQRGVAYLAKGATRPETLIDAIQKVQTGKVYIGEGVLVTDFTSKGRIFLNTLDAEERYWVTSSYTKLSSLTERQMEVARLAAQGYKWEVIAQRLDLKATGVEKHVRNIYEKLFGEQIGLQISKAVVLVKAIILYDLEHPQK